MILLKARNLYTENRKFDLFMQFFLKKTVRFISLVMTKVAILKRKSNVHVFQCI